MKNISLAAKYRPQTFKDAVGQETIKNILSEAAFQNKVAPAYLLSGTRGVGKTTLARVFAKALNCENADKRENGEPCNECSSCKRITLGSYVDVVEIDGASNRGIEDAKKIREMVQYAPLEGKYKVIIIDEAHMLTRESFNALLKTLEEPPSYTTFILATTEAHKFPITIVSRCQHFVFKQVPEKTLHEHLTFVLENEKFQYEEEAVNILVRRAAGSVRDSMSLLGQCLALSNEAKLTEENTRAVLGLAGRESLDLLLHAIMENNPLEVALCVEDIVSQGTDITYFLRELAQLWRTFFLLNQYKEKALEILSLSEEEGAKYIKQAQSFSPSFVHSAWQMTLEAQQKIIKSLEPAVALELFLINLSLLPKLLPIQELKQDLQVNIEENLNTIITQKKNEKNLENFKEEEEESKIQEIKEVVSKDISENIKSEEIKIEENLISSVKNSSEKIIEENIEENLQENLIQKEYNYQDFIEFLEEKKITEPEEKKITELLVQIKHIHGVFTIEDKIICLTLDALYSSHKDIITAPEKFNLLKQELEEWTSQKVRINIVLKHKKRADLMKELEKNPIVQEIQTMFNAEIIHCESLTNE